MSGSPPPPPPNQPSPKPTSAGPSGSRNLGDVLREFSDHQQTMRSELAKVIVGQG
ncbi:MAG: AAA family ATPase, partial [Rubripirellula sp.]